VSNFSPTSPPAPRPDTLAGAVLNSLARPITNIFSWGLLRTVFLGAITFGIAPLFALSKRLRHSTSLERAQLWHLAEWVRTNCGEDAAPLAQAAEQIRLRPILSALPPLCGLVALFGLIFASLQYEPSFDALLNSTYGYFQASARDFAPPWADTIFAAWAIPLGVGYISLWLAMQIQQNAVRRFVRMFSVVAQREGASEVPTPRPSLGLRPLWLGAGIVLSLGGAIWAIPMMLAAAAQRRYTKRIGAATRVKLMQSVREIMHLRRPDMPTPMPVMLLRTCPSERCAAKLPPGAKFCPRCGTRVSVAMVA
jgi:hypothetical protein